VGAARWGLRFGREEAGGLASSKAGISFLEGGLAGVVESRYFMADACILPHGFEKNAVNSGILMKSRILAISRLLFVHFLAFSWPRTEKGRTARTDASNPQRA
jgi:hypothetical protein